MTMAIALSAIAAPSLAQEGDLRWAANGSVKDVQFGEPETDNRLLRLRCVGKGRIEISGPLPADADEEFAEGQRFRVSVKASGLTQEIEAKAEERGDGMNFISEVQPGHTVVVSLLGNDQVDVFRGKIGYEVPGKGAGKVVKRMLEACNR